MTGSQKAVRAFFNAFRQSPVAEIVATESRPLRSAPYKSGEMWRTRSPESPPRSSRCHAGGAPRKLPAWGTLANGTRRRN